MRLKLYSLSCERNYMDKKPYMSNETIKDGTLRENCDVLNPVITVRFPPTAYIDHGEGRDPNIPSNEVINYNYCYLPEFGRYYFIDNVEWIGSSMHNLYLTVDVLYTYKDAILRNRVPIIRNEYKFTPYQKDDRLPLNSKAKLHVVEASRQLYNPVDNIAMGRRFYVNNNDVRIYDFGAENKLYLLVTSGFPDSDGVSYSIENGHSNENPYTGYVSPTVIRTPVGTDAYYVFLIGPMCYNWLSAKASKDATFASKILGIYYFPFTAELLDIDSYEVTDRIRVGTSNYTLDGLTAPIYYQGVKERMEVYKFVNQSKFTISSMISPSLKNLENKELGFLTKYDDRIKWVDIFAKTSLYIPFFGIIDVNLFDFFDSIDDITDDNKFYIQLDISLDPFNGYISYSLSSPKKNVGYSGTAKLPQFPLNYSNHQEIERNKLLAGINFGVSVATTILTRGTNILAGSFLSEALEGTKNPELAQKKIGAEQGKQKVGIGTDILSATSQMIGAFTQIEYTSFAHSPSDYIYYVTKTGKALWIIQEYEPLIQTTEELNEYAHNYGLPYTAIEKLDDMNGYTVCGKCHLENIYHYVADNILNTLYALPTEIEMISKYLQAGVMLTPLSK